jgi:phage gp36-like protein
MTGDEILPYPARRQTRQQHLHDLRQLYGFKMFSGHRASDLKAWLAGNARNATTNHDLARRFVDECRRTKTILPGISVIERLCADALVAAERRIDSAIVARLDEPLKARLDALLTEMVEGKISQFVWLCQFEVGQNSADATRLLDRLEFLQEMNLSPDILSVIPPHRVTRLQRQGERYFADGLRDIRSDRRLAIIAVCAIAWRAALADAVIEIHDRIVGKTWQGAKKLCDAKISDAKTAVQDTLRAFKSLGAALLDARSDGAPLDQATELACGWERLEGLVATAAELTDTMAADPLAHVDQGYHRFRRYAPRMLRALDMQAAGVTAPLLQASTLIADDERPEERPVGFLRRSSKWHRHPNTQEEDGHRLWEVAVLFHLAAEVSSKVVK